MKQFLLLIFIAGNLAAQDFSKESLGYPFYPNIQGESFQNITNETICQIGYSKTVRNVSNYEKAQVYKKYNVTNHKDGEIDHYISLELGGDNSLNNLWFEPYECYLTINGSNVRMGAHEKDKVENALRWQICDGIITIQKAQDIIVNDWVYYYLNNLK